MSEEPIRSFLIGLGNMGMGYDLNKPESLGSTHARALQKHPKFICIGAHDIAPAARLKFEEHYGVKTYSSLSEGLTETQPDFVIISSPTKFHLDHLSEVLDKSNPRMILCEKPIATSASVARGLTEKANDRGIEIFVNYFRCSNPVSMEIRENVTTGVYLSPFVGTARYNKGTLHTASHFLNLLIFWFGKPLEVQNLSNVKNNYDESDPNSFIQIKFHSGTINIVPETSSTDLVFEMDIDFSNGRLEYLNEGNLINWYQNKNYSLNKDASTITKKFNSIFERSQYDVLQNIQNFLSGSAYSLCDAPSAIDYITFLESGE